MNEQGVHAPRMGVHVQQNTHLDAEGAEKTLTLNDIEVRALAIFQFRPLIIKGEFGVAWLLYYGF